MRLTLRVPAHAQIQQGCERNIITYGSLISACDRAGRWQYALELLEEMRKDRVAPNTVTYNSLLSACAQGASALPVEGFQACTACVH